MKYVMDGETVFRLHDAAAPEGAEAVIRELLRRQAPALLPHVELTHDDTGLTVSSSSSKVLMDVSAVMGEAAK